MFESQLLRKNGPKCVMPDSPKPLDAQKCAKTRNGWLAQPSKITPARLHPTGVAVLDELGQEVLGVVLAGGVVVVLDAVYLDATVVVREGLEVVPGLVIGLEGVQDPIFEDEAGGVEVRCYGQARGGHFACADESAASDQILLAPVAALPSGREVLDGFAIVDALLGTVDPSEAQRHLNGVHVSDNAGAIGPCPIHAQPEVRHRVVILQVPRVQFLAGVDV